jgi:hypothetical protein
MHAIFDHIIAVIVGTVLIVTAFAVQQRGSQRTVESAIHGNLQGQTLSFVGTLERDVENMRTDREGAFRLGYPAAELVRVERDAAGGTTLLRFPTLLNPEDPTSSALVAYRREAAGETVRIGVTPTGQPRSRSVYRLVRYVNTGGTWRAAGGSPSIVVSFTAALVGADGTTQTAGAAPDPLDRVEFVVETAQAGAGRRSADQADVGRTNATRYAATPRTLERATEVPVLQGTRAAARAIPALPAAPAGS